jgi:hypothetical protein
MKKEILDVQLLPYLSSDLDKWKNGDFSLIPENVTDLNRIRVQQKPRGLR